ncbi:MAG: hypothetical protein WCL23_03805 [Candidatus Moraniibacteriota bacterium]
MKPLLTKVVVWLVMVNVFAPAAHNSFSLNQATAYTWITPERFPVNQSFDLVDMHDRWDTHWYKEIVNNGYHLEQNDTLSDVVFFPLYPFLIKVVGTIFLGNYVLAGWLISMAALIAGCAYLYALVREFHPEIDPELPVLLMLVFPTAFFFTIVYTEAIFFLFTVACFYYVFKKRFMTAGLFALFGALTHSNGVFLGLPILWETVRLFGWKDALFSKRILPMTFPAIGMFSFLLYDYLKFRDFWLFFKIESAWGRSFSVNWEHFSTFSHPAIVNLCIDSAFTVLIIAAIVLVWKKLSPLYSVFMSLTVLAALTSGTLMSIGRYSLVLFPLFILLARIKNQTVLQAWIFGSVLFLAMDIVLFVNNYWAG